MKRFAVIGLGNFGFHAAKALFEDGNEVVAIDRDKNKVQAIDPHATESLVMDATEPVGQQDVSIAAESRAADGKERVVLQVSDSDGFNPQTIFSSNEPVLSPAWSPDGRRLAYVSFENRKPAIYIQEVFSGQREKIADFPGINGAPAWSPDGRELAITLSKDGNPDIHIMDVASRSLRAITRHPAIDTEPAWAPDGRSLVFTSDRGGSPQIYRVSASGGEPQRVTFEGKYNARASYSSDGKRLTMVTRDGGEFRIGVLDLATKAFRTVSDGNLDESPSFAPNGSMIIYAARAQGRGVLFAVSADGRTRHRLALEVGDVPPVQQAVGRVGAVVRWLLVDAEQRRGAGGRRDRGRGWRCSRRAWQPVDRRRPRRPEQPAVQESRLLRLRQRRADAGIARRPARARQLPVEQPRHQHHHRRALRRARLARVQPRARRAPRPNGEALSRGRGGV